MEGRRSYYYSFDVLRVFLVLFLCIEATGFNGIPGMLLTMFRNTAPIAFFIISGFLVLGDPEAMEKRLPRAIKRTAIMFAGMVVLYLAVDFLFARMTNTSIAAVFVSKRSWFEFLALNLWPMVIGETICFIQCLLHGYIAMLLLVKTKLIRFDWIIILVCLAITLLTGEFAALVNFNLMGYHFLSANVVTRAIPYLLLGRRLYLHMDSFAKGSNVLYLLLAPIALCLTALEVILLSNSGNLIYYGHLLGNGLFAFDLVLLCAINPDAMIGMARPFMRSYVKYVYIIFQPLAYAFRLLILRFVPGNIEGLRLAVYLAAMAAVLGISWLVFWAIDVFRMARADKTNP